MATYLLTRAPTIELWGYEFSEEDSASLTAIKIGCGLFTVGMLYAAVSGSTTWMWVSLGAAGLSFIAALAIPIIKESDFFKKQRNKK